jgi:UDP-N-acetyl-D-mannosaminuronic acid transferase (WecB/TagA/CpsF family)
MSIDEVHRLIRDSLPYPVVFVDTGHCHNDASRGRIIEAVERLKNHANEIFVGVGVNNQRIYINPVRDDTGSLVGYFERFELNLQT